MTPESAIVLDSVFHSAKATVGPLFLLTQRVANLLGFFGNAFHKYSQGILHNMYPDCTAGQRLIRDLKIKTKAGESEITDACLIEGRQLVLFEIKGKWIRDDKMMLPDYEEYMQELRDKYGKAADQLANAVN